MQLEEQERDRRTWRSEVLAFDAAREACTMLFETSSQNMGKMLYMLEV